MHYWTVSEHGLCARLCPDGDEAFDERYQEERLVISWHALLRTLLAFFTNILAGVFSQTFSLVFYHKHSRWCFFTNILAGVCFNNKACLLPANVFIEQFP